MIAGIDEAGRGCVLGPLVVGICVIDEKDIDFFKEKGITDSKLLSKKKRELFFEIIKEKAKEYYLEVISAQELNLLMTRYSLNEIEAQAVCKLINKLKTNVTKIVIDCPDTVTSTFEKRIVDLSKKDIYKNVSNNNLCIEHKADLNYIVASCASILAKVTRDSLITTLVGENISGYSSDIKTINYIKEYILKNKCLPTTARTKWETIDKIMKELYQKKLGWFCEKQSK
jgi:ribonuclease HII